MTRLQFLTPVPWLSLLRLLDALGAAVEDRKREAVIGILAAVAKQEWVTISERVQAGLVRTRKRRLIPNSSSFRRYTASQHCS